MENRNPPVVIEDSYKDIKIVVTAQELPDGRWQAGFSGGGFDATTDPVGTLEAAQEAAKDLARTFIGRWLG